jgi:hypothetical protein
MNRWQERFKNPYSATVDSIFILDWLYYSIGRHFDFPPCLVGTFYFSFFAVTPQDISDLYFLHVGLPHTHAQPLVPV